VPHSARPSRKVRPRRRRDAGTRRRLLMSGGLERRPRVAPETGARLNGSRARSSAGERLLHTQEVAGSKPAAPTNKGSAGRSCHLAGEVAPCPFGSDTTVKPTVGRTDGARRPAHCRSAGRSLHDVRLRGQRPPRHPWIAAMARCVRSFTRSETQARCPRRRPHERIAIIAGPRPARPRSRCVRRKIEKVPSERTRTGLPSPWRGRPEGRRPTARQ
jgi:hypothetical protein